ncbi:MAG TPA: phosphatase PAP2 family protein [Flavisolibacter sp.]|nr:phosphatase PAP2 family protein [Flavisolibacter sp.]
MSRIQLLKCKTPSLFILTTFFASTILAQEPSKDSTSNIKANLIKVDTTAPAVYKINPIKTAVIGLAATAANMIAINNILHNKKDLTVTEVQALRPDIVNSFDRWALELDPSKRDRFYRLSDHALTAILAGSAATFVLNKRTRKDWLRLGLMYYETQFLTFAFYDFSPIGPFFQNRVRPVSYYDYFPMDLRKRGNQRNSLYSGHVANATSATFFAVKVYCDYHPEIGKKKYLLYGAASLPALFCGWARIKALAHFPSDVLVGYTIGGLFGILVPQMHRIKSNNIKLNTFYNGQSGGIQLTYKIGNKKQGFLME